MKIAVLPGDGIGTEIVAEAVKVLKVLDLPLEMETALVGGAAFEAHGHPLPEGHAEAGQGGRRHPVRRRRRLEIRHAGPPSAPRAGHPGPAQEPRPVRQLPPGHLLRATGGRLQPEARAGCGPGHPDHPRAHRRHLLRPAARPPRGHRRPLPRRRRSVRHHALQPPRDRTHRPRGVPGRAQAQGRRHRRPRHQRGQGQRAGNLPVLERRGHRSRANNTPTSRWTTCTWTTPPCSWSRRPRNST